MTLHLTTVSSSFSFLYLSSQYILSVFIFLVQFHLLSSSSSSSLCLLSFLSLPFAVYLSLILSCLSLQTEDYLKRKIKSRPERSELIRMHILEGESHKVQPVWVEVFFFSQPVSQAGNRRVKVLILASVCFQRHQQSRHCRPSSYSLRGLALLTT